MLLGKSLPMQIKCTGLTRFAGSLATAMLMDDHAT
jgi:hypothetical protein